MKLTATQFRLLKSRAKGRFAEIGRKKLERKNSLRGSPRVIALVQLNALDVVLTLRGSRNVMMSDPVATYLGRRLELYSMGRFPNSNSNRSRSISSSVIIVRTLSEADEFVRAIHVAARELEAELASLRRTR